LLDSGLVSLPPSGTTFIRVGVTAPAGTGGLSDTTIVTVTSQTSPTARASVTDRTTALVPLSSVTISGATGGYPGTYPFTASYLPANASPPVTYKWDNGDTTATSTRNLGVGVHTLKVTATNHLTSIVFDNHVITINSPCARVTGVTLSYTNTNLIYTDTVVYFQANIAPDNANKPYTYTITYNDGTPPETGISSNDPLAFTHIFATTGTHSVNAAVWNCTMITTQAVTNTTTVNVVEKQGAPTIEVNPLALTATLTPGATTVRAVTISNTGSADLMWTLSELPDAPWLIETPTGNTIIPAASTPVTIQFNAAGLIAGNDYTTTLLIASNDPIRNLVTVTVTLTVQRHQIYLPVVLRNRR
jgi:hypothetical protein